MRSALKITAAVLLLINSIGAIFGGAHLSDHPDGSSVMISLEWLMHTPFHDYLVPGYILFISNGLFGFVTLTAMFFGFRKYYLLIMAQGIILMGWLVILVGLSLVFIGRALNKMDRSQKRTAKVKR